MSTFGNATLQSGFLAAASVLAALALSCGPNELELGERTEDEPFDDRSNVMSQGLVTCNERSATGYVSGTPKTITLVDADARPAELSTANAYAAMQGAAAQSGVKLRVISGFRTMSQQQYFYTCYTQCSCNNCNLAAVPGYSNHQSGKALDLNTSEAGVLAWLNAHAHKYGFKRTVPSEPWHWEYFGGGPGGGPCGGAKGADGCTSSQRSACGNYGCGCADGACSGGFACAGSGCSAAQKQACGNYGCGCVDGKCSGGFCDGTGCSVKDTQNCAAFGCGCADGKCAGGFCAGSGCTAKQTNNCAAFGCGCVDGKCAGGFCEGSGCTAKQINDCGGFGCGCVDGKCAGGFCDGSGCTAKQTKDCGGFGCGCADGKCSGGFCPGSGCTAKQTNNCAAYGCGCSNGKCAGGFCPPG